MNANKLILRNGVILSFITLALFFLLLYLFATQGSITESQYFNYSALINSFALPPLYVGFAFYTAYTVAKERMLTFWQAWQLSFLPMFIGGLLSLGTIFIFMNRAGKWAQDSLQRGWYELIMANPNPEFLEENEEFMKNMTDLDVNLFSSRNFFIAFSIILFFYILISTIFAVFFNKRRV